MKEILDSITKTGLALVLVAGFFMTLRGLFLTPLPKDNSQMANTVIVALISIVTMAIGYFFGSSANGAKKPDIPLTIPPLPGTTTTQTRTQGGSKDETVTTTSDPAS